MEAKLNLAAKQDQRSLDLCSLQASSLLQYLVV